MWIWQQCMSNFQLESARSCLCPFLCSAWPGSGQWISGRVIVNHAPIQNLVSRAFENVKYQNASKCIKWLKMSDMMRFDQHIWYRLVAKCIPRVRLLFRGHRVTKLRYAGCWTAFLVHSFETKFFANVTGQLPYENWDKMAFETFVFIPESLRVWMVCKYRHKS